LSAIPIFSWSALVFGSTATWITGSGNSMRSSVMTFVGSHSVSPVVASLRPTAAAMSPARTSLISSTLVGVHLQDATDALLAALDRVVDRVARIDHAE
jgi:hypothetical protein